MTVSKQTKRVILITYGSSVSIAQQEILEKIARLINTETKTIPLPIHKIKDHISKDQIVGTFGIVADRMVRAEATPRALISFPSLKELEPKEENREARAAALKCIEQINRLLLADPKPEEKVELKASQVRQADVLSLLKERVRKIFRVNKEGTLVEVSPFEPKEHNVITLTVEELYIAAKLMELTDTIEVEIKRGHEKSK